MSVMNTQITLAWINRRGAHCTEQIESEDLGTRIMKLYKRREEAVAWLGNDRERVIAQVTPPHGGELADSPHDFWIWAYESPPYDN